MCPKDGWDSYWGECFELCDDDWWCSVDNWEAGCDSGNYECDDWWCYCEETGMSMLQHDVEEVKEFFNDLIYNRYEMRDDMEREWSDFTEDVECFWADRSGGDGWCWKREREQL